MFDRYHRLVWVRQWSGSGLVLLLENNCGLLGSGYWTISPEVVLKGLFSVFSRGNITRTLKEAEAFI